MATIESLSKRVESAKKTVSKLEAKLARIKKVEAQGWEDPNPYSYGESDLTWCIKDLANAYNNLEKLEKSLAAEIEKSKSRNVPAIVEFLNGWRDRVLEWYITSENGLIAYYEENDHVRQLYRDMQEKYYIEPTTPEQKAYDAAKKQFHRKCYGYYVTKNFTNRWGKPDRHDEKIQDGEYEWLRPYTSERDYAAAVDKLHKDLNAEWNRKYDYIIERTNEICGQIVDASGLYLGAKHDLNGIVIGTRGKAKIQTIGAGGYNIQCFHFRTLINKI